ncbi:transmembrane protein, putative (macronuclear) [Tetrahymena thermophila SB210]|uniref:Transmembrane protein, putative n=1 Tax=Tetrahymena thermophila (strain SB210) TaxID=312017 RepID=I7MEX5_TETTS|nr:transmembrane protein, putative [Tetrahymena thermophila SB210]EAR97984.2 transmembrane protein, putative [Tetrahymena thermophila SB210]|eukprot:XP_001018229.2 transmembrane protein, putative [Tetrahymena thermophila SB210]
MNNLKRRQFIYFRKQFNQSKFRMKKVQFSVLIRLILLIFLLLINIQSKIFIENCANTIIVFQDPQNSEPQPVCQECNLGQVVDYDFKSCIQASILPMPLYQYCKRLDRFRECDEGYFTIQIDENQLFVTQNTLQYDERCSKIDTINKICISPRFPYTLDISQNKIIHEIQQYCKIKNGQTCIQNYEIFYVSKIYNTYYGFFNFINLNMIKPNVIYDSEIQCSQNFIYSFTLNGCIPSKFQCLYNDGIRCKCTDGEAIDSTGSVCQYYKNCLVFGFAGQLQYCIKCISGYNSNWGQCISQTGAGGTPSFSSQDFTPGFNCAVGNQLNQRTMNYLQNSLRNLNLQITNNFDDPIYLQLLQFAMDFTQDEQYQYYFYMAGQIQECEQIPGAYLMQGCISYLSNLCIKCNQNKVYYVQKSGQLIPFYNIFQSYCGQSEDLNIPNCKVIGINKLCIVCEDFYLLQQNQCVKGPIEYCVSYDNQGNCLLCQKYYLLGYSRCVPMIKGCSYYDFSHSYVVCKQCQQNYYIYVDDSKQTSQCIKNDYSQIYIPCGSTQIDGQCQYCNYGSYGYKNADNKIICTYNYSQYFCQQFNLNHECQKCQDYYILFNGICYYLSTSSSINFYTNQASPFQNICSSGTNLHYPNQCSYLNKEGYYLDSSYNQQKCYLPKEAKSCNKCFQNTCLDIQYNCQYGYGWSQTFQKCLPQCLNGMLQINSTFCYYKRFCDKSVYSPGQYICQDCSIVNNINNCKVEQYNCQANEIYSSKLSQCMKYCGNGITSYKDSDCKQSNICQDGLEWSTYFQQCIYLNQNFQVNITTFNINQTTPNQNEQQKEQVKSLFSAKEVLIAIIILLLIILSLIVVIICFHKKILQKINKREQKRKEQIQKYFKQFKTNSNINKEVKQVQTSQIGINIYEIDNQQDIKEQEKHEETVFMIEQYKNQEIELQFQQNDEQKQFSETKSQQSQTNKIQE